MIWMDFMIHWIIADVGQWNENCRLFLDSLSLLPSSSNSSLARNSAKMAMGKCTPPFVKYVYVYLISIRVSNAWRRTCHADWILCCHPYVYQCAEMNKRKDLCRNTKIAQHTSSVILLLSTCYFLANE